MTDTKTDETAPKFETVAIPENAYNRTKTPNPFAAVFPSDKEALTLTLDANTDDDLAVIRRYRNQARDAAKGVDRTARVIEKVTNEGTVVTDPKTKEKTTTGRTVTLTIWTVKRITKTRKPDETPADDSTVPEAPAK